MGRPRRRRSTGSTDRSTQRRRAGGRRGAKRAGGLRGAGPGGSRRRLTITSVSPTGTISSSGPTVRAMVKDSETTLSKSDIHVYLDGEEMRGFQYQRSTGRLSFSTRGLSSDAHTVEIEASAAEDTKTTRKSWSFSVQ
jgi:hypothetical protein